MMNNLSKIEETLFKEFCKEKISNIVFILASPRTGSTPFYQALVSSSGCPYISNFTNTYFSEYPVIGLSIQHGTKSVDSLKSKYGKTNNLFGASEGSALFANWFGGGHPSQEVSSEAKEEKKSHFEKTVNSISALYGKPLIIKNAWNCFRIQSIVNIFPMAKFIWLKRDIGEAAKSDLEARYVTKSNPNHWNSATPRNVGDLLKKPYVQQVVENQYEFNISIKKSLELIPSQNWTEVFFEDFIRNPTKIISDMCAFIKCTPRFDNELKDKIRKESIDLSSKDIDDINSYIHDNAKRLNFLRPNF